MIIAAEFDFNNGREFINCKYPRLLEEVKAAIESIDAEIHRTKESEEKTMPGRMLFSPSSLNKAFKTYLNHRGWVNRKV